MISGRRALVEETRPSLLSLGWQGVRIHNIHNREIPRVSKPHRQFGFGRWKVNLGSGTQYLSVFVVLNSPETLAAYLNQFDKVSFDVEIFFISETEKLIKSPWMQRVILRVYKYTESWQCSVCVPRMYLPAVNGTELSDSAILRTIYSRYGGYIQGLACLAWARKIFGG